MMRWPTFVLVLLGACGGGGGGGTAQTEQQQLRVQVDVLATPVAGTPVPMLVSVKRGNSPVTDYVGMLTFDCDDPMSMHPSEYRFTRADQGQRLFSSGFVFGQGVHILNVTGEGIEQAATFGISVESSPNGLPVPPPGYVPAPPTGTSPDNGQALLTRMVPALSTNWATGLAMADVDGDGDLDLLICELQPAYQKATLLRLNNGDGSLLTGSSQQFPGAKYGVFADIDADGDPDLVLVEAVTYFAPKLQLWINSGGTFTQSGQGFGSGGATAAGDVDGDGDDDLVEAVGYSLYVHFSNGNGGFSTVTQSASVTPSYHLPVLGDLDGDGDLDLVANRTMLLNNGSGGFSASGYVFTDRDVRGVALGDIEGDGDLDIVLGNYYQKNDLYLNHGPGVISKSPAFETDPLCTMAIAVVDADEDGDLDIVEGNGSANDVLWINGGGSFTGVKAIFTSDDSCFVVGDLTGDGLEEVVGSRLWGKETSWYRND